MHVQYKTTRSWPFKMFHNGTHINGYVSSVNLCRLGAGYASSVSTRAYTNASSLHIYGACLHMHSQCISGVYRGDSKAKTALKAQIHLGNMAIVVIPWRKCPWGENKHLAMMKNHVRKATAWLKCIYAYSHSLALLFIRLHHIMAGGVW